MLTTTLFTLLTALAASAFPIKDDTVNCRTGPNTQSAVVRTYNTGDDVTLSCQTPGETINGGTLWGKTQDGCFVADWFISTGTADYVVAKCDAGPPPAGGGPCTGVNAAGIALIKQSEGFVADVYNDPTGNPTVGYGHLCQSPNCAEVGLPFPLTEETGTQLLERDIPNYTGCLAKAFTPNVVINDNQWAALTSFTYNLGCGTVDDIKGRINAGEDINTVISSTFPEYVHGGGEVLPGLVTRRNAEIALAQTASDKQSFPGCT